MNLTKGEVSQLGTGEFEYDETQLRAVDTCLDMGRRVVAVTGEAGTGKTTILRDVFKLWRRRGKTVVLCAPTGKAAKRITEATGIEARTTHRLLEYPHPGQLDAETGKALTTTDPRRDRQRPLDFDVILVDEYAMVNVEVHRNLLDALPPGGLIRMFGDANQLQPIESSKRLQREPSSFLRMLDKFDGLLLKTIHRQDKDSTIISNGHAIIYGKMPKRASDFVLIFTDDPVHAVEDFVMENLNEDIDYGGLDNQLITPTKKGWVGTEALNGAVQLLFQPTHKAYLEMDRHTWADKNTQHIHVGDKVIFTVNNYTLEVFNGELGIVKELEDDFSVLVDFGDKTISIPNTLEVEGRRGTFTMNPQKDLDLAYVITTHKSQGSEYDRVAYIMNRSRSFLLNRKNLYTGISRARKHVTLITDQRSLSLSLYKKGDK